jgi:hypothetical protein
MGSWWTHPQAGVIYNALESLGDRLATVKLVAGKLTLVAPRLWPDVVAVGSARSSWQLEGLASDDVALLDRVGSARDPVLLDQPNLRAGGGRLEERLLVAAEQVHTDEGKHLKAITSWQNWAATHGVESPLPSGDSSQRRFEAIVERWDPTALSLLPWAG